MSAEDRRWWITTGPVSDALMQKIAGPFASQDEAIETRVRIEEYTDPVTFWVVEVEPSDIASDSSADVPVYHKNGVGS